MKGVICAVMLNCFPSIMFLKYASIMFIFIILPFTLIPKQVYCIKNIASLHYINVHNNFGCFFGLPTIYVDTQHNISFAFKVSLELIFCMFNQNIKNIKGLNLARPCLERKKSPVN